MRAPRFAKRVVAMLDYVMYIVGGITIFMPFLLLYALPSPLILYGAALKIAAEGPTLENIAWLAASIALLLILISYVYVVMLFAYEDRKYKRMEEERRRLDEEGLRELLKMAEAAAERGEEERAREERRRRDREGLEELIKMAHSVRQPTNKTAPYRRNAVRRGRVC